MYVSFICFNVYHEIEAEPGHLDLREYEGHVKGSPHRERRVGQKGGPGVSS